MLSRLEVDRGQYDAPADVLWITGACLMVRMSVWRKLGGLDSRFFAHMEEIDLCWRMQLEGWKVTVVPASTVWHVGGGTLPKESPYKLFLNYRNNLLLLENNLARTLSLEMPPEQALRLARQRIFWRIVWDGCSAAVYFCTFRWRSVGAVCKAHREYRKLRRKETPVEILAWRANHPERINIKGMYNGWLIPKALFKGRKVFAALER